MSNNLEDNIKKVLIEEINLLNASDLERIAKRLLTEQTGVTFQSFGINILGRPVGYTVDGRSPDSCAAYECSAEMDYFTDKNYSKIFHDIEHAIEQNASHLLQDIFLLSSQMEPPSFRKRFNEKLAVYLKKKSLTCNVHLYSAQSISDLIYEDVVLNSQARDLYCSFFPRFDQAIAVFNYFGKPPINCYNHVANEVAIDSLKKYFMTKSICVLHGLSGSGKTEAAIEFAEHSRNEGYNILWLAGEDWKPNTLLESLKYSRAGSSFNITGVFKRIKTLLIVDNLGWACREANFVELEDGFKKGGRVLVTTQIKADDMGICLSMPELSMDNAIAILAETKDSLSDNAKKILEKFRFSPLLLSAIHSIAVKEGYDKEKLYSEVLNNPRSLQDEEAKEIIGRILEKLNETDCKALIKIANSGVKLFVEEFLKCFITQPLYYTLYKLSFIKNSNIPGVARLHDLICEAVKTEENTEPVCCALTDYFEQQEGNTTSNVLRQIYFCRTALAIEYEKHPDNHWIAYALLQIAENDERDVYLNYYQKPFSEELSLPLLLCQIDSREVYSFKHKFNSDDERQDYYRHCAEEYLLALQNCKYEEKLQIILLHHRGKALSRCHEYTDAVACFKQVILRKNDYYPAYVQLAKIGTIRKNDIVIRQAGEKAFYELLKFYLKKDGKEIPLRVMLQSISRLPSYNDIRKEIDKDEQAVERLSNIILSSALEGFGQLYEAFVAFTSSFGYHYPQLLLNVVKAIPGLLMVATDSLEKRQWISACEVMSNIVIAAKRMGDITVECMAKEETKRFTDEVVINKKHWKDFDLRAIVKAYNVIEEPCISLQFLKEHAEEVVLSHWTLYRKAEAELLLQLPEAVDTAIQALEKLREDSRVRQEKESSYCDLLARCYEMIGNRVKTLELYREAIDKCNDEKYEAELKDKLKDL